MAPTRERFSHVPRIPTASCCSPPSRIIRRLRARWTRAVGEAGDGRRRWLRVRSRCVRRQPRCLAEAPALRTVAPATRSRGATSRWTRTAAMTVVLEVNDLVKRFPIPGSGKVVQAVNGVNFTIERGETLALVGELGSGKTTIGRCVLGPDRSHRRPASASMAARWGAGATSVHGTCAGGSSSCSRSRRSRSTHGCAVGETLAEPLRYLGINRADRERRVREVAEHLGLPARVLELYPAELSAGQCSNASALVAPSSRGRS